MPEHRVRSVLVMVPPQDCARCASDEDDKCARCLGQRAEELVEAVLGEGSPAP